jgi:hypothetical protein
LAVECDLGDIETRRCTQWFNPTALHGPESHCLTTKDNFSSWCSQECIKRLCRNMPKPSGHTD